MRIIEIVATRCPFVRPKCIKFDFDWGCVPDPAGEAYSAPPVPIAAFKGPTSTRREGGKRKGRGRKGEKGMGGEVPSSLLIPPYVGVLGHGIFRQEIQKILERDTCSS